MVTGKKRAVAHVAVDRVKMAASKSPKNGTQSGTQQMTKPASYKKSSPGKAAKPMMGKGKDKDCS